MCSHFIMEEEEEAGRMYIRMHGVYVCTYVHMHVHKEWNDGASSQP